MATHQLVIQNDTGHKFEIEPYVAHEIMAVGVKGLLHLDDYILDFLGDATKHVSIIESKQECWHIHVPSFEKVFGSLKDYIYKRETPVNVDSVFKQLMNHHSRMHSSEYQVMYADIGETINRVKPQLKQLIFDMYEHEHAVAPEVPEPPQQDGEHDCNGTYVGDLIHNYNRSQPKHSLKDYITTGWTREQLLKEKLFVVTPAPPCMPMPVKQVKPTELVISHLLLDLKDNKLPDSVRNLVELLINLESE